MSKFKVGDRIRALSPGVDITVGGVYTVTDVDSDLVYFNDDSNDARARKNEDFELITDNNKGDNTVKERRTFKLLKDMPNVKKGVLFQEECEDGTQPYRQLPHQGYDGVVFSDRSVVEDQPQWFVEVFKVHPEYMTKEELEDWETFKKGKKKAPAKKKLVKPVNNAYQQVVKLSKQGIEPKEIARLTNITPGTVHVYRSNAKRNGEL